MACQNDFSIPPEIMEQIAQEGLNCLPDLIRVMLNTAMQAERQAYLGAGRYERSQERRGHANGFKSKTIKTRVGDISLAVPQVREGGFYLEALEKGLRSERALIATLAETYVQGVSTRRVTAIVEEMCGSSVSAALVSKAVAALDEKLEGWRNGELGEVTYLYLDARYEKVRQDGQVRDAAILIASGVVPDGHRRVVGVSVSMSEREMHWRTFLEA